MAGWVEEVEAPAAVAGVDLAGVSQGRARVVGHARRLEVGQAGAELVLGDQEGEVATAVLGVVAIGLGTLAWIRFIRFPPFLAAYEARLAKERYFTKQKFADPDFDGEPVTATVEAIDEDGQTIEDSRQTEKEEPPTGEPAPLPAEPPERPAGGTTIAR